MKRKVKKIVTFFGGKRSNGAVRLSISSMPVNHNGKTMPAKYWYGKMFDHHLAKYCNCSPTTIHFRRTELGIDSFEGARASSKTNFLKPKENFNNDVLFKWKPAHAQKDINAFLLSSDMKKLDKKYG